MPRKARRVGGGKRKKDTVSETSAKRAGQDSKPAALLRAPFSTPHRGKPTPFHIGPSERLLFAGRQDIPPGRRARPGVSLSGGTGTGGLGQPRACAGTSPAAATAGPCPARRGCAGPRRSSSGPGVPARWPVVPPLFLFVCSFWGFVLFVTLLSAPQVSFWFCRKETRPAVNAGETGKAGRRPSAGAAPPDFPRSRSRCSQVRAGSGRLPAPRYYRPSCLPARSPAHSPRSVTRLRRTGEPFATQTVLAPIYFSLKIFTRIESKSNLKRRYPICTEFTEMNFGHGSGRAPWQRGSC